MSIEINGTPVDFGAMNGGVESSLRWAELALRNANTRIADTTQYVGLLAASETPVPVEEMASVSRDLTSRRTQAEFEANSLKALADLLEINRGGVGYPELQQA